jgi:hypothetical protein
LVGFPKLSFYLHVDSDESVVNAHKNVAAASELQVAMRHIKQIGALDSGHRVKEYKG